MLDAHEVVLSGSPTGGGAENSISGTETTPVLHWQMRAKSLCAKITLSSTVLPHKMKSCNRITTLSVTILQIIATATKGKVFPRPISSTTSAPGIPAYHTHLLTMHWMAHTWSGRNLVPSRPGIEFWWPGTRSSVDWWIGCAFSSLTASSRHSCSNSLLIALRTVFNTELVFAGSRTSSPSSTCS